MSVAKLPHRRRLLFGTIIAMLSVALFFGALEGGVRLAGYGHDTKFYRIARAADGTRWIRENRDFTLTYFPPAKIFRMACTSSSNAVCLLR